MTLARARVLANALPLTESDEAALRAKARGAARPSGNLPIGRRVAKDELAAREEAARIVAAARAEASRLASAASQEAREAETARLAAAFLSLRRAEEQRAERDLDRVIEIATLLAERLVGESIRLDPTVIAHLAANALTETRGGRRVRIDASPEDVEPLRDALAAASFAIVTDVRADAGLARGSLVIHTDLGDIDARLRPQLERLVAAVREAMR
jgi:flagellar biosynthesis/type III secretory pathway protein FliH